MEDSIDAYPDRLARIVRNNEDRRELAMVRWGMPSSQKALLDNATKRADKLRAKGKDVDAESDPASKMEGGRTIAPHAETKSEALIFFGNFADWSLAGGMNFTPIRNGGHRPQIDPE
jgi:putative SOS response-associated peptidase YedK